jgi:cytochrome P450
MSIPESTHTDAVGGIFVDPDAYLDLENWHERAAFLRREDPVHRVEIPGWRPFWALTRYEDIWAIERQHQRFPNRVESVLQPDGFYESQAAMGVSVRSLVQMDDPEHKAYRSVANDWFKPANMRRLAEDRARELSRHFVDRMVELGPECDFAREIGLLYPLRIIMAILGVPEKDEPMMLALTQKLFGAEDAEFGAEGGMEARLAALLEFHGYFSELTEGRRGNPAEDLATLLAEARVEGEPIGDLERFSYYLLVATAGHDTTSNTLNAGIEMLARDPSMLKRLRAEPSLIPNAVDEMIRWASPARHFLRYATEDVELHGKKIKAGDCLLLSYLSANRDEEKFADPFRFDVARANANEHLAFGTGVHFCLGAHLARLELRVFLEELVPRAEALALVGRPQHLRTNFVGGVKNLPLRYRLLPAAGAAGQATGECGQAAAYRVS